MEVKKNVFYSYGHILLSVAVLLVYLSPNIFFQEEAKLLVHDNLDPNVVWFKNIAESPVLFGGNYEKLDRLMNGLDRGLYVNEYRFIVGLYYFLSPIHAYHINIIFIHLVAFLGMLFLLNKHVYKQDSKARYIIVLISLAFSLLPFWPSGGIGVAGIPFLACFFSNLYKNEERWWEYLFLLIYPLYSELVLSGVFVVAFFTVYFLVKMVRDKKLNLKILISITFLTLAFIVVNYRLFQMVLFDGYETGRVLGGFSSGVFYNYKGIIGLSFLESVRGQHHFHTMSFPTLIVFLLVSFVFVKETRRLITVIFGIIFLLSLLDIIVFWDKLTNFILKFDILTKFRFRWKTMSPFLWYFLLAKVSYVWFKKGKIKILLPCLGLIVFSIMFSIGDGFRYNCEFAENSFYKTYFDSSNDQNQTFKEFYMLDQFKELKSELPENTKVACLGILPEIAQFNNYNTLGGYYVMWSKEYQKLFEQALGDEKAGDLDHAFYLTSKELNTAKETERDKYVIQSLGWNFEVLKNEGVNYILSSNLINIDNFKIIKKVEKQGLKPIYLYKI